nr:30S ribosomal protein S9, mitochondrial-like [Coffea arabica]
MLSRLISKSSNLRFLTLISSQIHLQSPNPIFPQNPLTSIKPIYPHPNLSKIPHFYSTSNNSNNNNGDRQDSIPNLWQLSSEADDSIESIFGVESEENNEHVEQVKESANGSDSWLAESLDSGGGVDDGVDKFKGVMEEVKGGGDGHEGWATAEGYKPWSFAGEDKEDERNLFDVGGEEGVEERRESGEWGLEGSRGEDLVKKRSAEEEKQLEIEEKALTDVLKGPNRAFGDLIAASGITEAMLDSLIALKDLEGIQGLPPLREIEDMRYAKSTRKSARAEIERQKQEEAAKARVRQVDDKGRAYGTGRRKCSIARVWVQPGDGKFVVNDKEFDVYFPMLDHRAALLRPFSETKTLGMWDVSCTVKGGGVSGQVGAIQLGISRALQNWAPDLRPPLREGGFLTRDSRVVERKKPGKAKARKSFQWVKR